MPFFFFFTYMFKNSKKTVAYPKIGYAKLNRYVPTSYIFIKKNRVTKSGDSCLWYPFANPLTEEWIFNFIFFFFYKKTFFHQFLYGTVNGACRHRFILVWFLVFT